MSSKRRIRRKSCTGKIRHLTPEAGWSAVRAMNVRKGYQGRMDVCRCSFCNGYHVGHSKGAGRAH